MKNVDGAVAQKRGFLKSIVLALLVCLMTVTIGCSNTPQKDVADIGGTRGQEIRKEASSITDIGGGKTIRGEFASVLEIGGGKTSNGTIQFSEVESTTDIGGKSSTVGQVVFVVADIGGRKDLSTGNVNDVLKFSARALASEIGGKDRDVLRLTDHLLSHAIGGGGKSTTTTLCS